MQKVPDYREIDVPISLKSLRQYIEPLLYQLNIVRDDEEIIKIEGIDLPQEIWIKIKLKKNQPVEVITFD